VIRPNAADLEAESMVTKHPIYQVLTTLELRIYTNLPNVFRAHPSRHGGARGESKVRNAAGPRASALRLRLSKVAINVGGEREDGRALFGTDTVRFFDSP